MLYGALLENHWNRQFSKSFPGPQQCYDHMSSRNTNLSVRLIFMEASFPFTFFWLPYLFCFKMMSSLKFSRQKNLLVSCCRPSQSLIQYIQGKGQVSLFHKDFSCFWNNWSMDHTFEKYRSERLWVKSKSEVETQQISGFPLSSMPDLPKRSFWTFEALNLLLLTRDIRSQFSVTALETHFTISSYVSIAEMIQ